MADPFLIKNQDNIKRFELNNCLAQTDEDGFWLFNYGESGFVSQPVKNLISWPVLKIFFLTIAILFLVLFARVSYLQVISGNYYRSIAEGNRIRIKPIKASRGIISDVNGYILVRNVPDFSLYFIPGDLPKTTSERQMVFDKVAKTLQLDSKKLEHSFESFSSYSYEPVLVAENIAHEQAILLEIEASTLPGVVLDIGSKRDYLYAAPDYGLAHILGYTGKLSPEEYNEKKNSGYLLNDYVGKIGLEQSYESYLRGQYGKKQIEVDFLGKEEKMISQTRPEDGNNLILSIDLGLQKVAWEAMAKELKTIKNNKGAVIVIDNQSGELLALVSIPSFNNNLFIQGISSEEYQKLVSQDIAFLFNRAIAGEYPPGSTIKPLLASAALQEKIITPKTTILSTGGIKVNQWFFPDWKIGGHGRVNVADAIAQSINTFFYYIGGGYENFHGLGLEKINTWCQIFGLGRSTGIDIIGENDGFLPTAEWKKSDRNEPWYIGDTYHLSIGQGDILLTPIQLANYISAIANGGILLQPRFVHLIVDGRAKKGYSVVGQTVSLRNKIDSEYLQTVREGMRKTITDGSARALNDLPVKVAGKTGTAQVGGDKKSHAWFVGFAPYDNPKITIVVLIENGGEGSSIAVPIAKEILSYYFKNK